MKFPLSLAVTIGSQLCRALEPHCERIVLAGSIRRQRPDVGDIEIVYIPILKEMPLEGDLFASTSVDLASEALGRMLADGTITKRMSGKEVTTWGPLNKLAIHEKSDIPVDFFRASRENWHNYLVCRTGGLESNKRICIAAQEKGWAWHPYGDGFTSKDGLHHHHCDSEESVFEFVGLPYQEPKDRP
jgi:DNA polymerase/3'-5' exonuclease PolX